MECQTDVPGPCPEKRRNIWFQAENFHAGGRVPSGHTTPEYWDGCWEGVNVQMKAAQRVAPRSATSKYARGGKKKATQGIISAKAKGCARNESAPDTDTPEKKGVRTDAGELLNSLTSRKVEYGREPERYFSEGTAECAKLGRQFLDLDSAGDHYAAKKHLISEMAKERKTDEAQISYDIWMGIQS